MLVKILNLIVQLKENLFKFRIITSGVMIFIVIASIGLVIGLSLGLNKSPVILITTTQAPNTTTLPQGC